MSDTMVRVTLDLPETLVNLPERERNGLIRAGVYEAMHARIRQIQAEIDECETHVHHFEERYAMSLQQFEHELLPALDTLQAHEDYNDWFYWQSVLSERKDLLAGVQHVKPI